MIASRTSCTLPHSAAVPVGRMTTPVTRRSTLALRSASISERTVGGGSKNCPITPPGSISWRSPETRIVRMELLATCGSRPTSSAVNTSPAAEMTTATERSARTNQTLRRTATTCLLERERTFEYRRTDRRLPARR